MKSKLLLTLYGFFLLNGLFGQTAPRPIREGIYVWKQAVVMTRCHADGTTDNTLSTDPVISIAKTQKFNFIAETNDGYIVLKVGDYGKDDDPTSLFYRYNFDGDPTIFNGLTATQKSTKNYGTHQMYFKVSVSVFEARNSPYGDIASNLTVGTLNFPFKFRPQKGNPDITPLTNFGAGAGFIFGHNNQRNWSFGALAGFSASNIIIDETEASSNTAELAHANNFGGGSFAVGFLMQYLERVQVGIFIGWDRVNIKAQRQYGWKYQGMPWIGLGWGFSIFTPQKEQASKSSDN